ncbi:MAG: sulfotransferase domain-containing protein [Candidatus Babeliales bacterium]|nr:sulfotransferase domain-containing protein [Candidatus Babeliales bacterium]
MSLKFNAFIFSLLFSTIGNAQNSEKIFFSSIPKCGTHLLKETITFLTKKKYKHCSHFKSGREDHLPTFDPSKEFIFWHIPYSTYASNSLTKQNFRSIFLYRDPRDQLISYIFWVIKDPSQIPFSQTKKLYPFDWNDFLTILIQNVNEFYKSYIPWINSPNVLSVKFEDLISKDKNIQINTIKKICSHIKVKPTEDLISNCYKETFGKAGTFREGKKGAWRKYFSKEHVHLFKKHAGQLLIDLKYEKDFNW